MQINSDQGMCVKKDQYEFVNLIFFNSISINMLFDISHLAIIKKNYL